MVEDFAGRQIGRAERVAEQARRPLIGVAALETVEIFETQPGRPQIERTGRGRRPGRGIVMLAEEGGVVAVILQHLADRRGVARNDRVIAGKAQRRILQAAEADLVMVAAGQQSRPRRRAQSGRMEFGVFETARRQPFQIRRGGSGRRTRW